MSERSSRLGAGRHVEARGRPDATATSVHEVRTQDGATARGVLFDLPGAETVVCLMHPRQDFTHHPLVPLLLGAGVAVWTQQTRSVNNDLALIHEQAVLDVAAGQAFLRDRGFASVILLGHSGGGTLFAFYQQQAATAPGDRLVDDPSGRPVPMAAAAMPPADAVVFVAPHPGQGEILQTGIDPSVVDEDDALSVSSDLDAFDPANGFAAPPASSSYSTSFLAAYRDAQAARIRRIDEKAFAAVEATRDARREAEASGSDAARRASLVPALITVHRTDADPRTVDLGIDPNERPYGSVFGRRPDLINYGLVGFGRLSTAEAWLSTWSANHTRARFVRCASGVHVPVLFIELTGDQAAYPSDTRAMIGALNRSTDLTTVRVRGTHFGRPIADGEPEGNALAAAEIAAWLRDRFDLVGTSSVVAGAAASGGRS